MQQQDGIALEIRFTAERLNDMAGDPYWIDLTVEEARRLHQTLQQRFASTVDAAVAADTLTLD